MPKKSHCKLLVLMFLLWIPLFAWAQSDSSFLTRAVSKLAGQPATEKVYLHLDKPGGYFFGDTIWYKAYTVIGQHHQLSALSGVLYVELINPKDSVVTRQTLHLVSGIAWGDIPLLRALKQGSYRIRAYTNWMRNFDPAYFYDQRIRIGGIAPTIAKPETAKTPDVQFFPEGGQLVEGVRSRVAVKAIAANGLGEDIKGTIEDNEGNIVADFATQHLGMGVFALIPQAGKTYKAKITIPGETAFTVDLPKAQAEGYTLALNNNSKDSIYIKIAVNEKVLNEQKSTTFYIIAQNNGKVYYTAQGKLESLVYSAKVEKSRFPTGISNFTLFSQSGEPLAERIAFIQGSDTLKLSIAASNQTYTTRQKIKIDLKAQDNTNNPATGSFSVAVINESRAGTDENSESTIENNLLLTSDLKGYIEQPNHYFTNSNTEQKQADLDILMLTQGYRRFEWKQVLGNTSPVLTYQPERTQELNGTLKKPSGEPLPNGKVTLVDAKDNLLRDTTTDAGGNFKFSDLAIMDTTTLVLRARKENNGNNVRIGLKQPEYPKISVMAIHEPDSTQAQPQNIAILKQKYTEYQKQQQEDILKNGKQIKEVIIKGYKHPKQPEIANSSNLNGPGNADQVLMMSDAIGAYVNLSDYLEGRAFGVYFSKPRPEDGHRTAYLSRSLGRITAAPAMVAIVDGMIMDGSHLDDINVGDVYSVEILKSGANLAVYGSNANGGAIIITTKRGGEDSRNISQTLPNGIITVPYIGFTKTRAFYVPKYSAKVNAQLVDENTTIYWNPNIITDKDGNASFEYLNNDTKGTYRVVVEGIDDNGNLGRQVYRYKVQ